ncbi:MAG: hypothetical protein PHD41_07345 [Methanosarcinaceae archaeon]|nr:hypothetical protein [Methanosarcinaceae archaeon]MDD4749351.1 hypothetical protein [Methanosarcinaceae archaeon]
MKDSSLKFTPFLKNGARYYRFEKYDNVSSRGELPCEYICGPHFAVWEGVLLYSDGKFFRKLRVGEDISEKEYLDLKKVVELGKERLRQIRSQQKKRNL